MGHMEKCPPLWAKSLYCEFWACKTPTFIPRIFSVSERAGKRREVNCFQISPILPMAPTIIQSIKSGCVNASNQQRAIKGSSYTLGGMGEAKCQIVSVPGDNSRRRIDSCTQTEEIHSLDTRRTGSIFRELLQLIPSGGILQKGPATTGLHVHGQHYHVAAQEERRVMEDCSVRCKQLSLE